MDLSIIIPVYNGALLLPRCLDSVCHQTTRYSFEIILVDDGSTDESVDIIKARKENNIVLWQQQNSGPAVARNKGMELAKGRYCAYLDADDYWNDGYIEKTVTFLDEHADCVAVTVGQMHKTVSGNFKSPAMWMTKKESFVVDDFFEQWAREQFVGTCATTMRTDAVRQIGGQRLDLRVTEDWEFWFRLATQGKWGFVPGVFYVSDGMDMASDKEHWLGKMAKRWRNAPSIAEWERDVVNGMETPLPISYQKARGIVSRNLTYCQLLSGRTDLARQEAKMYGDYFKRDQIGRLMNLARHGRLLWGLLCKFLTYREYHRFE